MSTAAVFTDIPIVSLHGWRHGDAAQRRQWADELCDVCHQVGFLQLVDHGLPDGYLDRYFDALRQFFALPDDTKATIDKRLSRHFRGWERVGAERTNNRVDFREQLDVSTEWPARPADVEPAYLRLDGPNQWLPDETLPGFRATIEDYFSRLGEIANSLLEAIEAGLELAPQTFLRLFGERPTSYAKLISYPPTPRGEAGVNAHHDAGFLTLLSQHRVGGLQALNPDDQWVDVPVRHDALVVNLGENLQAMTGNYFVATTHRVIAAEARFSAAYFHGPDMRTELRRLPLPQRFAAAVDASPRHRQAGFMATLDDLQHGSDGTQAPPTETYGQQLWNYYVRSYPDNVRRHHPEVAP